MRKEKKKMMRKIKKEQKMSMRKRGEKKKIYVSMYDIKIK
jgi:hypothetical protein